MWKIKRILGVFCSVMIILTSVPLAAFAENTEYIPQETAMAAQKSAGDTSTAESTESEDSSGEVTAVEPVEPVEPSGEVPAAEQTQVPETESAEENLPEAVDALTVPTDLPEPEHSKYVTLNNDGTYTLTLNVKGREETVEAKKADILLIVDTSGSMSYGIAGTEGSRLQKMKDLVKSLSKQLLPAGNTTNQMAIVQFNKNAALVRDWTSSADDISDSIGTLGADDGTNWEAGFLEGQKELNSARSEALKYVIFLSDGDPTYYYDSNNQVAGTGSSGGHGGPENVKKCYDESLDAAKALTADKIYSVGVGSEIDRMKNLAAEIGDKAVYYNGLDADALDNAFSDIASEIKKNYSRITISDTLSEYADMVDPSSYEISAVDKQGNLVPFPEATKPEYDVKSKTVTWKFDPTYVLKDGVTYSVSFKIVPSQAAKDQFIKDGRQYPAGMSGGAGTGATSEDQSGYYSNTEATLQYGNKTADYNKPVIQVTVSPITELPKAGGSGVYGLLILGLGVMTLAAALLIIQKKRETK